MSTFTKNYNLLAQIFKMKEIKVFDTSLIIDRYFVNNVLQIMIVIT